MYNIAIKGRHPAVICVELSRLPDSLLSLPQILSSEYVEESLQEFIETYARTDEVKPDDKTVGFVVVNSEKKIISLSFSAVDSNILSSIRAAADEFRKISYTVDLDLDQP